jgi:hypothetical protein
VAIDRLVGSASLMGVKLRWDATTALLFWAMGANTFHHVKFRERDGIQLSPCPGLLNGAGVGRTGKILISTVTAVANASYAITLWLRKTSA